MIAVLKTLLVFASLFVAAQAASAQQSQPNCVGSDIGFIANQNVAMTLTVRKGKACGRAMSGGQNQINNIQFVQKPKHGTLRRVGRLGYAYTPRFGYAGPDQFLVRYVGYRVDDRGNKAFDVFFGVKTDVNVVP